MKRLAHILIITILTSISITTSCMHNKVIIKTADNQECRLPQWKIEASRLLHRKQELQAFKEKYSNAAPAPISLKTISPEKLYLFSNALDEHDIPTYLKRLNPKKRNLLLCAVNLQELDSPYIMCEFLKAYFQQDFIKEYINPHLPTTEVANYLHSLIIRDNYEHKKFTQTRAETTTTSFSNFDYKDFNKCPIEIFTNKSKGKTWILTRMEPFNDNDYDIQTYLSKENKKKLWLKLPKKDAILQKIIEHTNVIAYHTFSNDGKYLATSSTGTDGTLILTDLTIKNDMFVGTDIFLTGHTGWIHCICFNEQSTILAAVSGTGIYFWDTQTYALLTKLELPERGLTDIFFNHNDTRLVTSTSLPSNSCNSCITLWDITDINNISIIKSSEFKNNSIQSITFTPSGNNIVVKTRKQALVLNGWSGETIFETNLKENCFLGSAVAMPFHPILITTSSHNFPKYDVALWDINSGECIATLLENEPNLTDTRVNADGRFVTSTNAASEIIQTELYDTNTHDCLQWIQNKLNPTQRYLLLRLYRAYKGNDRVFLDSNSAEYHTLQNFPFTPCNVKAMVENYLLKK